MIATVVTLVACLVACLLYVHWDTRKRRRMVEQAHAQRRDLYQSIIDGNTLVNDD